MLISVWEDDAVLVRVVLVSDNEDSAALVLVRVVFVSVLEGSAGQCS